MHEWFELKQFSGFFLAWGMFENTYYVISVKMIWSLQSPARGVD